MATADPPLRAPPEADDGRWALARGARATWRTAVSAWRLAPPAAARRWAATLAVGLVVGAALAAVLSIAGERWASRGGHERDVALLQRFVAEDWLTFHAAMWVEGFGSSEMLLPLALLATVLAARAARPLLALTMLAGYVLHKPLVWLGWQVWDRARPDLVAGGIATPPLHSFPSGHAAQVVVMWGLVLWLWARRSRSAAERALVAGLLLVLLLVVGYARIRLGTHWPSDIVAGAVLGVEWLLTCVVALRRAEAAGGR